MVIQLFFIKPGSRDRHGENEQQLVRTKKEGRGQRGLENTGW